MRPRFAALIVALGLAPAVALASTLTRHPSIWLRTESSVRIAWQTDAATPGKVLYGPTPLLGGEATQAGNLTDHAVTLTGLDPATTYFYRIVSDLDTLTDGSDSFRTAPSTPEPFRFLAFGDLGRATPAQIQIAARIEALDADLAILTGDIIYEAGEAANFTPQYFDIYRPTIRRIPFYSSLGNHDVGTLNGQPYLDAFHLPANGPAGERYYSFDYGDAHFVALECVTEGMLLPAPMLGWLDADLAASAARWKFVFLHVPIYSNGGAHGNNTVTRAQLEPIFTARGVDIVFQGHNHYYTRTYPIAAGTAVDVGQEPDYENPGGPIYIVTGGAGRFLHALGATQPFEVLSRSTYHVTVIDVSGNSLALAAVEADGTVIDAMTLTKQTATDVGAGPPGASGAYDFAVGRARPNPFAQATEIPFTLERTTAVRVAIVDAAGRSIRTLDASTLGPGPRAVRWDGRDDHGAAVARGIYFARVRAGQHESSTRLLLLR